MAQATDTGRPDTGNQETGADRAAGPSALACFGDFIAALAGRRPALFLDYDGTLVPLAPRPELAVLDEAVRGTIRRLSALCPVAVVSGRDLDDVARMVGLEGLVYAGSHGFDIRGPGLRTQIGQEYLGELEGADIDLRARLAAIPGTLVERKRFAIAIHTRQVAPPDKPAVAAVVRSVAAERAQLRVTGGKEILELRPNLPWDKGRAVLTLLDALGLSGEGTVPLYLGDDETDEDAFRALSGRGFGIRVGDDTSGTAAQWRLRDPAEAARFLDRLAGRLAGS
ncbi:trehalose-phosphatase [Azospirillum thermophilum]|uniref:trehalose-phosphatase n=1 Tax=Azospirillum thermophilum TaxID=2202148 RepID=UPI001FEC1CB0|nr:trehalose-phosphatase [Azospirillum thermophilum]